MADWNAVYINNPALTCDFCGTTYSSVGRDDNWLNACEPCGAEGQAQLDRDDERFGKYTDESPYGLPEAYTYSPDR
jgi:hypothetical protein